MLSETIDACIKAIDQYNSEKGRQSSAEEYSKALKIINDTAVKLNNTLDFIKSMDSNHIVHDPLLSREERDNLLETIDTCGNALNNGEPILGHAKAFKAQVDALEHKLNEIWKKASSEYSEKASGYLSIVSNLTTNPEYTRELETSIKKICNSAPIKSRAQELVNKVKEAEKLINSFSLNPTIETFLKKVSSKSATISDLSPEILTWLGKNNLMQKLKVQF